jgi:anti-sigma factor RsiW
MIQAAPEKTCQLEDVAAYLDGELNAGAQERFENHLAACAECAAELRLQRQLLCTLDVAFGHARLDLPRDFTRVVTARAENDLSGMRNRAEQKRALQLCAVLALITFAVLGAATRAVVFDPIKSFLRIAASLLDFAWRAASEMAASVAVVGRVITRAIVFAPGGLGVVLLSAFGFSLTLLPFLIAKYHRARIIE